MSARLGSQAGSKHCRESRQGEQTCSLELGKGVPLWDFPGDRGSLGPGWWRSHSQPLWCMHPILEHSPCTFAHINLGQTKQRHKCLC